jgi:hypothetical protein
MGRITLLRPSEKQAKFAAGLKKAMGFPVSSLDSRM